MSTDNSPAVGRTVSAEEARRVMRTPYFTDAPDRRSLAYTVVQQAEQIAALRSALERTEANFRNAVSRFPVRDMAENLAENARALGVTE